MPTWMLLGWLWFAATVSWPILPIPRFGCVAGILACFLAARGVVRAVRENLFQPRFSPELIVNNRGQTPILQRGRNNGV